MRLYHDEYEVLELGENKNPFRFDPSMEKWLTSIFDHVSLEARISETKNDGIRRIFEHECAHVRIDHEFYKKLCEIESRYVCKNSQHIEFFGGHLTGVQVVRFVQDDMDVIFSDLLGIDELTVQQQVHELPDIVTTRMVSSNIFNIACVWIMHAIENSPHLDEAKKLEAKIRIALYLNYRFLTSILFHVFKRPADPDVARATYAQLSFRYLLKAEGSWGKALRVRSKDLVDKTSIWYKTIKDLDDDYDVVRMLNDAQGRIKDILKNIITVHMQLDAQGTKIHSISATVEIDGEVVLRDRGSSVASYGKYLRSIIPDKNSFIRPELLAIIHETVPLAPPRMIQLTLEHMSANFGFLKEKSGEDLIDAVIEHAIFYLSKNRALMVSKESIEQILLALRGTYTSSRATESLLMKIKTDMEEFVKAATRRNKIDAVVSSTRTAVCLYLVLRAFTMRHYEGK